MLLDWRGTLVVGPTHTWLIRTALLRLGRDSSDASVASVDRRLNAVDHGDADSSSVDTDPELHRAAYLSWFFRAGIDDTLARELYAVESEPSLNPFAHDVGPLLAALHAANVRIGLVSDIHVDLRPYFAAQPVGVDRNFADLIDVWVLSFEVGVAKPDPAIFAIALELIGLSAPEVLMVGDRGTHDGAAIEAGIATLLLPPLQAATDQRLQRVLDLVVPGVTLSQG